MEAIAKLKEICRKKHKKAVTKPHWWATLFARRVSIYITWFIVKYTKISANQVTIWQLIASLFGLGLLCFSNTWIALIGTFFLHLGYIFDNVDGEVARYRKSQSINGMFLDFVNHEIIIPLTFGCFSFHLYFSTGALIYFGLGIAIILCCMNPVGKARQTIIYYLVEKRNSPTYDFANYQNNESSTTLSGNIASQNGINNLIKKTRKIVSKILDYPNNIIIITILLFVEIVTYDIFCSRLFTFFLAFYLFSSFILSLYIHLKNRVPERDFRNYIAACVEIKEKLNE